MGTFLFSWRPEDQTRLDFLILDLSKSLFRLNGTRLYLIEHDGLGFETVSRPHVLKRVEDLLAAGVLLVAELVAWEGQNNLEKDDGSVYREQFHKNACFISKYVLLAFYLILGTLAFFMLQLGEQLSLEDPTSAKYTCHHKLVHSKLANATKFLLNIFIPLKSILINGLKKDRFSRNKHLVAGNEPTTNQLQSNSANHKTTTP